MAAGAREARLFSARAASVFPGAFLERPPAAFCYVHGVSRRVELTVGKQVLRLSTTAPDEHLVELVTLVEAKLASTGGAQRQNLAEAALMAALALADELVAERGRRSQVEQRARETVIAAIARVDEAISHVDAR